MADETIARISRAIGDLMRVAGSERVHAARQAATGIDRSRTEMQFLALVEQLGPTPVTELGAVLHLSQPTASRTLAGLEEAGLVKRGHDANDARITRYEITAAGRRARAKFQAQMDAQLDESLSGMPEDRRKLLADLLEELVAGTHRER